ncbi:MAG TPA: M48 family metallopeptidase [Rhizomicrobium sp.]|jgi:STE24 endopeptidase|nr:M48 family metallopeptidase [Rhizomicrobium sp.]
MRLKMPAARAAWTSVCVLLAMLIVVCALPAGAQDAPVQRGPHAAPTTRVEVGALPVIDATPKFDPERATNAYLARVSGAARARSDAYFEGGYWLTGIDLVYGLAIAGILLGFRISAGIRDWAAERTRSRYGQTLIYVAAYIIIVTIATLPLTVYESYFREHAYGLSNQTFQQWADDFGTGFAVSLVSGLIVLPILYAAIRKARELWWIWGAGIAILFIIVQFALYPVLIAPLFNHYSRLPDSPLKRQILSLARANDVPADDVWQVDASRQSNRISANVSGFLGTTRISLNDNLMKQGTPDEVLAVLGHEMGHYVMGHVMRLVLLFGLVVIVGFGFLAWGFGAVTDFFGGHWDVRRVDDIAGLPLLAALASIYMFVMTPVTNTIVRTTEHQADIFGLDAVRKPDAFASVMLKLSSYRKLEPGKWEEIIFYDHPSGRTRIHDAMVWKKEHINDTDIRDTVSPQ